MFLQNLKSNFVFYSTITFGYIILHKRRLIDNYISKDKVQYKYYNSNYNKPIFCKKCKNVGNYYICISCWMKMFNNEN